MLRRCLHVDMTSFDEARLQSALQHEAALRRLARGLLRDPAAADDATHHALLQEASGRRAAGTGLWPFLVATVRNHANNVRKLARRRMQHERAAAPKDTIAPACDLLAREQLRRRVADAVLALEEPYRTTVWLRWFEDMSPAAIAAQQQVPLATVRTRLQRAHAQLRRRLDADFGDRRWALLVALPWGAVATPALLGVSVMAKKWFGVVAIAAIAAAVFTVPWLANPAAPPHAARTGDVTPATASLGDAPAAAPDREGPAVVAAKTAATPPSAPAVRVVHTDGTAAAGLSVHWWTAQDRPGWTERIDPTKVRRQWPRGMGPGRWSDPWPAGDLRTTARGDVALPDGPPPVAISVRLADGLYFSTSWANERTIELPPLGRLDLAVADIPANARWRGGCFAAWREGDDEEQNHGFSCTNVDTGSGPGIVRWDRVPFTSDANHRAELTVLAGRPCAIEAEGIGFQIEPPVAFAVAPGAVTFHAGERLPQVLVQITAADGSDLACRGWVWSTAERHSQSEELADGRASLDRTDAATPATIRCLLDDGRWFVTAAPNTDPTRDVALRLSVADAAASAQVAVPAGIDATAACVWIDVDGTFAGAMAPGPLPPGNAGVFLLDAERLLLAHTAASWRGGFLMAPDGRVATFRRPDTATVGRASWLPATARSIDVPALSREFGDLPVFGVQLEVELPRVGGEGRWVPLRSYRRWLEDDHPQQLEAWAMQLPTDWRARLTFTGGPADERQSQLEQRLLR